MKVQCFIVILGSVALLGCTTPAVNVMIPNNNISVNASKIVVEDLSTPKNEWETGISLGFRAIPDNVTNPAFTTYIVKTLKERMSNVNKKSLDTLEVKVLEAQIVYEMTLVDAVPFVAMVASGSERKYICRANINLKYDSSSDRRIYEVTLLRNGFWRGLGEPERVSLVEECGGAFLKDIAAVANEMIQR